MPAPPSGSCRALQAGRSTQGSLPAFVPSCSAALSFWMSSSSPQELQGRERKTPKGCTGLQCSSPSAGVVEFPLLPGGQEGVNLEPRNASVTSSYTRDGPGGLQEDPGPGELSRRVELAPAWPGGAGGSASPRPGGSAPTAAPPEQLSPPSWECATNSLKKYKMIG